MTHVYGRQMDGWPFMLTNAIFLHSVPTIESINSIQNLYRDRKKGQQDLSFSIKIPRNMACSDTSGESYSSLCCVLLSQILTWVTAYEVLSISLQK